MKNFIILVFFICIISCKEQKSNLKYSDQNNIQNNEVSFYTNDSIKIFGDLYESTKNSSTVLLFHQGGANSRGEYNSIIPKLVSLGFNVLAIDQRLGGQMFGNYNRTVANIAYKDFSYNGFTYCDAYSDLESTLDFANKLGFNGDKILWGSSYSASLAIKLANNRKEEIKGVLAFSPVSGKPMQECKPDQYFETINLPLLLLRPINEMQSEKSKKQFELAKENGHEVYIAKNGTHGSSMLVENRVNKDIDENWKIVNAFLEKLVN